MFWDSHLAVEDLNQDYFLEHAITVLFKNLVIIIIFKYNCHIKSSIFTHRLEIYIFYNTSLQRKHMTHRHRVEKPSLNKGL